MMRLRSGSLKREGSVVDKRCKHRNLNRTDIPDLNLNDEVDVVWSEEGGEECCGVSKNGSICEGGVDDVQVENKERTGGLLSNCDEVLKVFSAKINIGCMILGQDTEVSGDGKESGVEKSNCGLGLVMAEGLKRDKNLENHKQEPVNQGEEEDDLDVDTAIKEKPLDICVTMSENGKCNSNSKKGHEDCGADLDMLLKSNSGEVKDFPEKISVVKDPKSKFDEGEQSDMSKSEAKEGKFQGLGKVLRSRIVPAKGLGEDGGVGQIRSSPIKRKRQPDGPGEVDTMKDVGSKVPADSKTSRSRQRPKKSNDLPDGEVVNLNIRQLNSNVNDANDVSLISSGTKRKRGRPRKYIDHPINPVVHTHHVLAVSEMKDTNLDDISTQNTKKDGHREQKSIDCSLRSSRKKKRGRPKKSIDCHKDSRVHSHQVRAVSEIEDEDMRDKSTLKMKKDGRLKKEIDCSEVEHEVLGNGEDKVRKLRPKSAGSSAQRRKSERSKNIVDYCENEGVQRKKFSVRKIDYESEDKDKDLSYMKDASSKKKGKRGRPKKQERNGPVKMVSSEDFHGVPHKATDGVPSDASSKKKGKRGRPKKQERNGPVKMVSSEDFHGVPHKVTDGVPSVKGTSPDKKMTSGGPDLPGVDTSLMGDETLKNENNLSVECKKGEASVSLATKQNLIGNQIVGEVPSVKRPSPDKKKTSGGPDLTGVDISLKGEETLENKNNSSVKCKKGESSLRPAAEKNLIRNQIVNMLLHAGWTIEHKPRNGREYSDAVYVNRKGHAYWSVTKAYYSLQQEFEKGNSEFPFTPLPEEVLRKLFRVVTKIRSDKNKKRKHKEDGEPSDKEDKHGSKAGPKNKHSALKRKSSVQDETQSKRRCALVARRSKGLNSESVEALACMGKHSIFAWLIDSGVVSLDGKVKYINPNTSGTMLEGKITRDGIYCHCCKKKYSALEFEKHSGSELSQPYENLLLESGQSLIQCQLDSWNKQDAASLKGFHSVIVDADDPNDDTCAVCGDGGDLMCCDGCPSTFHHNCLNMEEVPLGEWHCVFCSCNFCGEIETQEIDDCDTAFSSLLTCCLCQKKYHLSCVDEEDVAHVTSGCATFCGKICEQIFKQLQTIIGTKTDLGDGYSWTLLQRFDVKAAADTLEAQKIENNSKLAVALSVMNECFVPIIDPRSRINLIPHVIYNSGSNLMRIDFSSFFTIVLEKGDEVISAASIRIHGKQLAEMPFIGTRNIYRRKGMCRRLLTAIELALGSLGIKNLIIPAIPALLDTWTSAFGFQPLEKTVREEMRSMNMVLFAHTDMLQKPLPKQKLLDEGISPLENNADGTKSCNEQLNRGAEISEVDDGCFNAPFDLNVVAPGIPESSFDDRPASVNDLECGDEVKNGIDVGGLDDSKIADRQPTPAELSDKGVKNSAVAVTTSEGCVTTEYLEPSESSCKTSSDGVESSTTGLFLGSGVPKVGSN